MVLNLIQYVLFGISGSLLLLFSGQLVNVLSTKSDDKASIITFVILISLLSYVAVFFQRFSQNVREKHIFSVQQYIDKAICEKIIEIPHDVQDTKSFQDDFSEIKQTNSGAWMVFVDTVTGKIVSIDGWQSEKTASFGPTANNTSDLWGYDAVVDSYNGMHSIGYVKYNKYHNDTYTLKTNILNYMGLGGNEYAIYVRCHANESFIAGKNSSGTVVWKIYPSDMSGNWHFAFLDGCKTGASNNFATALHIYGYSNRAFLGWYDNVLISASGTFVDNYWPILASSTTKTVRQAALDTAALISASTPIRFYGDTSYNGRPLS